MRVELRTEFTGTRDGVPWPKRGEEIDLPDDEAVLLLNSKHAVPVKVEEPETAAAPVPAPPVKK